MLSSWSGNPIKVNALVRTVVNDHQGLAALGINQCCLANLGQGQEVVYDWAHDIVVPVIP